MIRATQPNNQNKHPSHPAPIPPTASPSRGAAYDQTFWLTYLANTSLMVAISLLFRYADFVTHLGGDELNLGWIVGVGMVGSLLMRLWQGVGIDRYGPRQVWLLSLGLFVASLAGHRWIASIHGPEVYLLRILFCISIAGAFGSSITYVSRKVPPQRMPEIIGMLGTSGFVGMAVGPGLGDLIFGAGPVQRIYLDRMFLVASALGGLSMVSAWLATRGQFRPSTGRRPPAIELLRRYHPGWMLLIGIAMGIGMAMPHTFLRTYTAELGISRMREFFYIYTLTAFTVRMATRRLPERIGPRPMILMGMTSLATSMLAYLLVSSWWHLPIPALLAGVAHAFLFPSMVGGGSTNFPARYRGLGTTLMLGSFDMGVLIGTPLIGGILRYAGHFDLPPYPTMFVIVATGLLTATGIYGLASRGQKWPVIVDETSTAPHVEVAGSEPAAVEIGERSI